MAEVDVNSVGARLRAAREAAGLSLEDIVARTRIPTRHLAAIEQNEWDTLPAPTYTVGFARSYANVIGLNGNEIAAELRSQLNMRQSPETTQSYYEPADPARVPSRAMVIAAVVIALLVVGGYLVWRNVAFNQGDDAEVVGTDLPEATPAASAPAPAVATPPPASTAGPVVVTATDEVWLRIYEAGGQRLKEGIMKAGERFEVPATAQAPLILTGRPDAIKVTVGSTDIPPLGAAKRTIADVSLAPRDLLARLQPATPAAAPAPPATPTP